MRKIYRRMRKCNYGTVKQKNRIKYILGIGLCLLSTVCSNQVVLGEVYTVTSLENSGKGTLRDAIGKANESSEHSKIVFAPNLARSTIMLSSELPIIGLRSSKTSIAIDAREAPGLVIDASGSAGTPPFCVFGCNFSLSGVTIKNAFSDGTLGTAGALYVSPTADVTLSDVNFINCQATVNPDRFKIKEASNGSSVAGTVGSFEKNQSFVSRKAPEMEAIESHPPGGPRVDHNPGIQANNQLIPPVPPRLRDNIKPDVVTGPNFPFYNDIDGLGGAIFSGGNVTIINDKESTRLTGNTVFEPELSIRGGGTRARDLYIAKSSTVTFQTGSNLNKILDGGIAGEGNLVKKGIGNLIINGDCTAFYGPTMLQAGILTVNSSFGSPITVKQGGTLRGFGNFLNGIINHGGTVSPGNLNSSMKTTQYSQDQGSTLNIEITPNGQSSFLAITGTAELAGTLSIQPHPGTYIPGTTYNILSANTGINGTFSKIGVSNSNLASLKFKLHYSPTLVQLVLPSIAAAVVNSDGDQSSINCAQTIDGILANPNYMTSKLVTELLSPLADLPSDAAVASAINQLTENKNHAIEESILTITQNSFIAFDQLSNYLSRNKLILEKQGLSYTPTSRGYMAGDYLNCNTGYGLAFYGSSEKKRIRDPNIYPYTSKTAGLGVVMQTEIMEDYVVGGGMNYAETKNKIRNLGGGSLDPSSINSYQILIFNKYNIENTQFKLSALYGKNQVKQMKHIIFPGVNLQLHSKYEVDQYAFQGSITEHIPIKESNIIFAPQISFLWDHLHRKAYIDVTSSPAAQSHRALQINSVLGGLGFSLIRNQINELDENQTHYEIHYNYFRDFTGKTVKHSASFVLGGPTFNLENIKPLKNTSNIGGSIRAALTKNINLTTFYDLYLKHKYHSQSVVFKVTCDF